MPGWTERPTRAQWGVELGYWDVVGQRREPPASTVQTILEAMGAAGPAPRGEPPMRVVSRGEGWPELPAGTLLAEDGSSAELAQGQEPPPDLPFGYHRFEPSGRPALHPRCVPLGLWGGAPRARLGMVGPAVRDAVRRELGYRRLRRPAPPGRLVKRERGRLCPRQPSACPGARARAGAEPVLPELTLFREPALPAGRGRAGRRRSLAEVAPLAEQARALNSERRIDRTRAWAVKSKALEPLFDRFDQGTGAPDLDRYIAGQGWPLDGYTTFCALAERHGLPWQGWPSSYRRPTSQQVAAFAASAEGRRRKRYHAWLQWLCDNQMAEASSSTDLICDLAVGVDGEGADAWLWQDVFAMGMRVGAPPDDFNVDGQDWGVPPWDPWKLRGAAYEPYIETLRAAMRHARGLRLDHVMGLFRLFWVPVGHPSRSQGTYVRYPWHDLLSLLCLEALRAGAYVVGEDLGTVEDEVREVLARRRGPFLQAALVRARGRPRRGPTRRSGPSRRTTCRRSPGCGRART